MTTTQQVKVRLTFEWEVTLPEKETDEWNKLLNETALDMEPEFSDEVDALAKGETTNEEFDKKMAVWMAYHVRLKAEGGDYTDMIELIDDDAEIEYVDVDL